MPQENQPEVDPQHALEVLFSEADREHLLNEAKRADKMAEISRVRWQLVTQQHRLETGETMGLDDPNSRWNFQKEIFASDAMDLVWVGSTGVSKSEFAICDDIAKAMCGMRVFHVLEKDTKRDTFVKSRINPLIQTVPAYQIAVKHARDERQADADSVRFKHFGTGSICFIGSNSESDFYSYRADAILIDEHQLCNQDNISKCFNRMSGSPWQFSMILGNPKYVGTSDNHNLDWHYKQSDQRQWHVPCPNCKVEQILGWWTHFVEVKRNEYHAIQNIRPFDLQRDPDGPMEIRPFCTNCHRPMERLSRDARWIPLAPGRSKRGYQNGNLINPTVKTNDLFKRYLDAFNNPSRMQNFINDQLGLAYTSDGDKISLEMLEAASTGVAAGAQPYRLVPANQIQWRQLA